MARSVVGKKSYGSQADVLAGAYMPLTVFFERAGTTVTDTVVVNLDDFLPPGMKVRLLGASYGTGALGAGTIAFTVGTSGDADAYLTSTSLATGASGYANLDGADVADATVGDYEFDPTATAPADTLRVTVTLTGATFDTAYIVLWMIPTAHDSDIAGR